MILPSKHLNEERALITVGADVLRLLSKPVTISRLWTDFKRNKERQTPASYDWFILGLDVLYAMGLVEFDRGRVRKMRRLS